MKSEERLVKTEDFEEKNEATTEVTDRRWRPLRDLRISVTDRCNFRCRYCMPADGVPQLPHQEILSFEELERLVGIFAQLGIVKVRVTGGEPFARKGCVPFLRRLTEIPGSPPCM